MDVRAGLRQPSGQVHDLVVSRGFAEVGPLRPGEKEVDLLERLGSQGEGRQSKNHERPAKGDGNAGHGDS